MTKNFLKKIWDNPQYKFYSTIIACSISGGTFVFWIESNQIQYLKDRNEDLNKKYELTRELDKKKCENEKAEMRINIEMSLNNSYKKLKQGSKEADLFMEAYQLIHGGNAK